MYRAIALAIAIGAGFTSANAASAKDDAIYLDSVSCTGDFLSLRIDASPAELSKLGKVLGQRSWKEQQTSLRELTYDGMAITVVQGRVPMIEKVVISKPQWNVVNGVRIGDSIQSVVAKIGKGAQVKPVLKVCGDTDCGTFWSMDGRITRIELTCYTG